MQHPNGTEVEIAEYSSGKNLLLTRLALKWILIVLPRHCTELAHRQLQLVKFDFGVGHV